MSTTEQWSARAACLSRPGPFDDPRRYVEARRICRTDCPVLAPCLIETMRAEGDEGHGGRSGIAGGLSPRERVRLRIAPETFDPAEVGGPIPALGIAWPAAPPAARPAPAPEPPARPAPSRRPRAAPAAPAHVEPAPPAEAPTPAPPPPVSVLVPASYPPTWSWHGTLHGWDCGCRCTHCTTTHDALGDRR